jgi:hypothetical protein
MTQDEGLFVTSIVLGVLIVGLLLRSSSWGRERAVRRLAYLGLIFISAAIYTFLSWLIGK